MIYLTVHKIDVSYSLILQSYFFRSLESITLIKYIFAKITTVLEFFSIELIHIVAHLGFANAHNFLGPAMQEDMMKQCKIVS